MPQRSSTPPTSTIGRFFSKAYKSIRLCNARWVHQKVDRTQALAEEEKCRQEEESVQHHIGERELGTIYKEEESSVVADQNWLWPSETSRVVLVQSLCH